MSRLLPHPHRMIAIPLLCAAMGLAGQDPPSQNAAAVSPADQTELRALAREFYTAYIDGKLERLGRLWSPGSPDLDARMQSVLRSFASHDRIELKRLALRRILIANETARVRLEVQVTAIDPRTGKPSVILEHPKRAMHCVRENGAWKMWREIPAVEELIETLTAAQTDSARLSLLQEEQELTTAEILQELERQGNDLRSRGNQGEALVRFRLAQIIAEKKKDR